MPPRAFYTCFHGLAQPSTCPSVAGKHSLYLDRLNASSQHLDRFECLVDSSSWHSRRFGGNLASNSQETAGIMRFGASELQSKSGSSLGEGTACSKLHWTTPTRARIHLGSNCFYLHFLAQIWLKIWLQADLISYIQNNYIYRKTILQRIVAFDFASSNLWFADSTKSNHISHAATFSILYNWSFDWLLLSSAHQVFQSATFHCRFGRITWLFSFYCSLSRNWNL